MAPDKIPVAVFIDAMNAYHGARSMFSRDPGSEPAWFGQISPYKLGCHLAAAKGRGSGGQLIRVEVHRGRPPEARDGFAYNLAGRQGAAWVAEAPDCVSLHLRNLRYPPLKPDGEETGVDVALALGVVDALMISEYARIAVLLTADQDLMPVCDLMREHRVDMRRLEVAHWQNHAALSAPGVHRHQLTRTVFDMVRDDTDYASEERQERARRKRERRNEARARQKGHQ